MTARIHWSLVRDVSRSFYFTLRLLPRSVRSGITLAYLLARASDTLADTSCMEVSARLQVLQTLRKFSQGKESGCDLVTIGLPTQSQTNPAERRLLEQLPELLKKLKTHPDREEIQQVWSHILEGQIFDLTHPFFAPLNSEQLDRYTFLVAGCVGKFWTQLCSKKIPRFASLPIQRMEELGICYGKGLQLINILRDREEDASRGRIYILKEDVASYRTTAFQAMRAGMEYAIAVNRPLFCYATLLPALIGIRTLRLIHPESGKVKISRAEVRRILITALPCLWKTKTTFAARLARSFGI